MSGFGFNREQLRSPLARRLVVAIILFSSAITLVLTGLQLYGEYRGQLTSIEEEFRQITDVHLQSLSEALWSVNVGGLRVQLEGIVRVPNLEYVAIREGGKLWAEAGRRTSENVIERQYALTSAYRGRTLELGTLTVVAGLDAIYRELIVRAFVILAGNALKTFLVAGFAFALFQWLVSRHLAAIAKHLRGIDLDMHARPLVLARAAGVRPDELEEVVAATNFLEAQAHSTLAALRESEARFRSLIELSSDYYWELDEQFRFTAVVGGFRGTYAYPREAVVGRTRWEIPALNMADADWAKHRADLEAHREFRRLVIVRPAPDGGERVVSVSGRAVFDEAGRFRGYRGIGHDVTEERRSEEIRQRFRAAMDASGDMLLLIDPKAMRYVDVNASACRMLGYTREEMLELGPQNVREETRETLQRDIEEFIASAASSDGLRGRYIRKDGSKFPFELTRRLLHTAQGPLVVAAARDISVRLAAEAELREASARLEALTRRLLEVQEDERRSVARELHDEVGGVLTAVKLNLQALGGKRQRDLDEGALGDSLMLVDSAIHSVRSLSLGLRPAVLDDLGFIPALKWYCESQAARAGVAIDVELDAIDLKSAPQLESACFRIAQEAVNNALRHAGAHRIRVMLRRSEDRFELEIVDDGRGFAVAAARLRALAGSSGGLLGMEERAGLHGGRFGIDSAPGAGTRVTAEFGLPDGGFA